MQENRRKYVFGSFRLVVPGNHNFKTLSEAMVTQHGEILVWVKNLTRHFVRTGLYNNFAPFSGNFEQLGV